MFNQQTIERNKKYLEATWDSITEKEYKKIKTHALIEEYCKCSICNYITLEPEEFCPYCNSDMEAWRND
jgi:rubrerythrin